MTVALPKGGNVFLAEEAPGVDQVRVCLGWNDGPAMAAVEVDGVVVIVDGGASLSGMLLAHQVPNPAERLGVSPPPRPIVGDADKFVVTLAAVPADVRALQFGAVIYDAADRGQTFRSVRHAYVRVLNHANGIEFARFTLDAETGLETAVILGELYRHSKGWKFRAVGQGYDSGLPGLVGTSGGDVATARPSDVAGFLLRTSRTRSRRNTDEHLHPPHAHPPTSTAGAAAPAPTPSPGHSAPASRPSPPPRPLPVPPPDRAPDPTRRPPPPADPAPPRPAPPRHDPPWHEPSGPAPSGPAPSRPAPSRPAPSRPAPVAARSPLDLSGPDETTPADAAAGRGATRQSPARSGFGERSSGYRQRHEQVRALDDDHPATAWSDRRRGSGAMTVNLRWAPLKTQTGLPRPSNIHLGCLWQANDGGAGVLQGLGVSASAPGRGVRRQVLRLGRRDEREGQTIFVDLGALLTFKRFFVVAFGMHSAPDWALLRPVLTVGTQTGEQLTIRLSDAPPRALVCVVASFHVVHDDVVIRRENDFVDGPMADAAARYGWSSLEWNPDRTTLRDVL